MSCVEFVTGTRRAVALGCGVIASGGWRMERNMGEFGGACPCHRNPCSSGRVLMRAALFLLLSSMAMSACSENERNQSTCGFEGGAADIESAKREYGLPKHSQNINIGINGFQDKNIYIYFEIDHNYVDDLKEFQDRFTYGKFLFKIRDYSNESLCFKWWDNKKYNGIFESYESRTEYSLRTYFVAKRDTKFLVWISSTN